MRPLFALAVGINTYASRRVPDLRGCENDARVFASILRSRFGVPSGNILVLESKAATREAIIEAFETHLIGNVRAGAAAGDGCGAPAAVYFFAGHGSKARPPGPGSPAYVETTVPHDSRAGGLHDIKDWELGNLIGRLSGYTDSITVVLDCCHSGHGTRHLSHLDSRSGWSSGEEVIRPTEARVRGCLPDEDDPTAVAPDQGGASRSATGAEDNHVLFAACRFDQLAHEVTSSVEGRDDAAEINQGVFTLHLVQTLSEAGPAGSLACEELHRRVRARVTSRFADQTPSYEGTSEQILFGGVRPVQNLTFPIEPDASGTPRILAGYAHGMDVGSRFIGFAHGEQMGSPPVGADRGIELRVVQPHAAWSSFERVDSVDSVDANDPGANWRFGGEATYQGPGDQHERRSVVIATPSAAVRDALEALLLARPVSMLARPAIPGETGFFRLEQVPGAGAGPFVDIQDGSGRRLLSRLRVGEALAAALCHLCRFFAIQDLRNRDPGCPLAGQIELRIVEQLFDHTGQALVDEQNNFRCKSLEGMASGGCVVRDGDRLALEIVNRSQRDVYVSILCLGLDFSVTQLYPARGAHKPVPAHSRLVVGGRPNAAGKRCVRFSLPRGVERGSERLLALITVEPCDCACLALPAVGGDVVTRGDGARNLDGPLKHLFETMLLGSRGLSFGDDSTSRRDAEWLALDAEYELVAEEGLS